MKLNFTRVPHKLSTPHACIGLIILGLPSRTGPEFLTEYNSVLLDGHLSVCASIVHFACCAEIFTVVDVIALVLLVIVGVVVVVLVSMPVVVATVLTVAVC